jgi:hypothetical protein
MSVHASPPPETKQEKCWLVYCREHKSTSMTRSAGRRTTIRGLFRNKRVSPNTILDKTCIKVTTALEVVERGGNNRAEIAFHTIVVLKKGGYYQTPIETSD